MIPAWQWAAIGFLILMLAGFAIYTSPNSFAHAVLAGQCNSNPAPVCQPLPRRGNGFLPHTTGRW
jgi:hypothetical protein